VINKKNLSLSPQKSQDNYIRKAATGRTTDFFQAQIQQRFHQPNQTSRIEPQNLIESTDYVSLAPQRGDYRCFGKATIGIRRSRKPAGPSERERASPQQG
jgi:hypothetical protein